MHHEVALSKFLMQWAAGMRAQAAISMCEGNMLSVHLLGDAIALAAAAAQAPWLCTGMCTTLGQLCCCAWVIMQVG